MEPKFFKATENVNAAEMKQYLPVNVQFNFNTIKPFIYQSENKYIIPLLGVNLSEKLANYYEDSTTVVVALRDKYKQLLEKVQFSLIRLALFTGFDFISVTLTDSGAMAAGDADKRLFKYQEQSLKNSLKNDGFDFLDDILLFLENNSDFFEDFKESSFYTKNIKSLIRSTEEFNSHYSINNSRLVFLKMKYFIDDIEKIDLTHHLGSEFVEELINADRSLEKYSKILHSICHYVVYSAVAAGCEEFGKLPTERGLIFETSTNESNITFERPDLKSTKEYYKYRGEAFLISVINYIKQNKDTYPKFIEFAGENATGDTVIKRDNTGKKSVFL